MKWLSFVCAALLGIAVLALAPGCDKKAGEDANTPATFNSKQNAGKKSDGMSPGTQTKQ